MMKKPKMTFQLNTIKMENQKDSRRITKIMDSNQKLRTTSNNITNRNNRIKDSNSNNSIISKILNVRVSKIKTFVSLGRCKLVL